MVTKAAITVTVSGQTDLVWPGFAVGETVTYSLICQDPANQPQPLDLTSLAVIWTMSAIDGRGHPVLPPVISRETTITDAANGLCFAPIASGDTVPSGIPIAAGLYSVDVWAEDVSGNRLDLGYGQLEITPAVRLPNALINPLPSQEPLAQGPAGPPGGIAFGFGASTIGTGTVYLSNSPSVTFGIDGSTITASAGAAAGGVGVSAGSQLATSGSVVFSNSNNVSFGMSNSSVVTASASFPAQTAYAFSNGNNVSFGTNGSTVTASASYSQSTAPSAISAGSQSATSGPVVFANSNGLTFGMSGSSQITASYTVPSVPAQTSLNYSNSNNVTFGVNGSTLTASASYSQSTAPSAISAGSQSATSGPVVFANSNGLTFGMSGSSQITASYTVPTVPAVSAISGVAGSGNSTVTNGTLVFSNSNNLTFGLTGSTMTASASYSQSTAPAALQASGTSIVTNGTVQFANSNGLTFGLSGSTITGSYTVPNVPAVSAISGIAGSGASTVTNGTVQWANSNNVTFGLSGSTITASIPSGATATGNLGGIADSAGTQTSGTVQFANSNNITFGLNAGTMTASYMPVVSFFENPPGGDGIANPTATNSGAINLSLSRFYLPYQISATRADFLGSLTCVGSTVGSTTMSFGLYTRSGSTLSRAFSTANNCSWNSGGASSNSDSYSGQHGIRIRSMALGTWNLTPGEYWVGWIHSAAGVAGTTASMTAYGASAAVMAGGVGGAAETVGVAGMFNTATGAFPASMVFSDVNFTTGGTGHRQPYFNLYGTF